MKTTAFKTKSSYWNRSYGFTLIELLVVVAVIGILAGILLPTLAKSKARAQGVFCLNNTKQLTLAWIMYADDHNGRLAYNLGASGGMGMAAKPGSPPMKMNWANNVLTWGLDPDNTNSEQMVDYETGMVKTSHTLNPVEFIYVAKDAPGRKLRPRGKLADIARQLGVGTRGLR